MKLINKTKLNDKAILDMVEFAHVNVDKVESLTVADHVPEDIDGNSGRCRKLKDGHFYVYVTDHNDEYLETMIHELVHINHFVAVKQMSEYKEEKQSALAEKRLRDLNDKLDLE